MEFQLLKFIDKHGKEYKNQTLLYKLIISQIMEKIKRQRLDFGVTARKLSMDKIYKNFFLMYNAESSLALHNPGLTKTGGSPMASIYKSSAPSCQSDSPTTPYCHRWRPS